MPAAVRQDCGVKIVSVRPGNAALKLPTVPSVYVDIDEKTGFPTTLMDG